MAGYTPTPPPAMPPYSNVDIKNQRRALKAQMRFQREQVRMQARQMRRRSIVGPLFLVALGVVFLLVETGNLNSLEAAKWYGHWWPLLLIVAGILVLGEWALDQTLQRTRQAQGLPVAGTRRVGSGVIWLLLLVGLVGFSIDQTRIHFPTFQDDLPFGRWDFVRALGDPHDSDDAMTQPLAPDSSLIVDNPYGDVTVSGTSTDGQMHIAIHKHVYALNDKDAAEKAARIQPVVDTEGGRVSVHVPYTDHGQADLTFEVPRSVLLTITADHGDVRVSEIHSPVIVNGNRGSVDVDKVDGDVTAHMHSDGATLSAHSIRGTVTVDGRTGDANVSDIQGAVSLGGNFSGTTHMERITGAVRFRTHRTDLQLGRLDGEVDFDTGENFHADQMMGPVVLKTSDRNITLERVQGSVNVSNRNGSVTVTSVAPLGAITIDNHRGSVDVGVPPSAGFSVHASTRHGAMENDFSLEKQGSEDDPSLSGTVGHGGPAIQIATTDGDVTLRKSTLASLPAAPAPPAPPKIAATPAPPAARIRSPRAPKASAPAKPISF